MPRSTYHHGDLRTALLRAGREALRVSQVESLSLRDLSRTVGVTPTAAYRHFRNKEELLEAIAVAGFGELRDALRTAARTGHGVPPLEALVAGYRTFVHAHTDLVTLMFQPRARGRGSRSKLHDAAGECLAEFVAVAAEMNAGDDPEAAIRAAVLVWSAVHGFAMLAEANALVTLDPWMLPTVRDLAAIGAHAER